MIGSRSVRSRSRVIGSRSRAVRSRLGVVRSRSRVGLGSISGFTTVLDIGHIARVVISNMVGDGLDATIGQSNVVFAVGGVAVTSLVGTEVDAGVIVLDGVSVLVVGGSFFVRGGGGMVGGGWGMIRSRAIRGGRSSHGHSQGGEGKDKGLYGICGT